MSKRCVFICVYVWNEGVCVCVCGMCVRSLSVVWYCEILWMCVFVFCVCVYEFLTVFVCLYVACVHCVFLSFVFYVCVVFASVFVCE